jgi:uncharacterized protein (TIGR00255 family)
MINSMTGYGRASNQLQNTVITVEVKSVNHRFSDVSVRMPKVFLFLEEEIKKEVQKQLHRGRIEVFLTVEGQEINEKQVNLDKNLLKQYIELINTSANEHNLTGKLTVDLLIHIPELFSVTEKEENVAAYEKIIISTVHEATTKCLEMRAAEGNALLNDISNRIHIIEGIIADIKLLSPQVIAYYHEKVKKRLEDFIGKEFEIDESKLLTEVALFAEKADISEELTRLNSHCQQFLEIAKEIGAVGRKLDFLVQEMNRETNTIGAKANDFRISQHVVSLKSELEKIKEQVQNIE